MNDRPGGDCLVNALIVLAFAAVAIVLGYLLLVNVLLTAKWQ